MFEVPKSRLIRVITGENRSGAGDLLVVLGAVGRESQEDSFKLAAPRIFKDLKDYKKPPHS